MRHAFVLVAVTCSAPCGGARDVRAARFSIVDHAKAHVGGGDVLPTLVVDTPGLTAIAPRPAAHDIAVLLARRRGRPFPHAREIANAGAHSEEPLGFRGNSAAGGGGVGG